MPPAPRREPPARLDCDVLILGAGLAGMRAAWAASEAVPGQRVLLVSPRTTPSGSSFANRNNALGMQAPQEHEAQGFVDEVLRLAPPGLVRPELVRALAQDGPARLDDLLGLDLTFRRQPGGALTRFPGCFSTIPRAVVFDGLPRAQAAFLARVRGLGVTLLHGFAAEEILVRRGRACGARLVPLRGGQELLVAASTVIAALGGPAPLFARRLCGPGGSGLSYGLLARAGARLVNTRYLQFFWSRARDLSFVNPASLPWPAHLAPLAAARALHCPLGFGLPDAALDQHLLAQRGPGGLVRLPGQEPLLLAAHAGNGGALIDGQGRTSVPGLYACGECAGGMHGANRLGGGMVLSALVFGARAGAAAALEAGGLGDAESWEDEGAPTDMAANAKANAAVNAAFLRRLRRGMDRHGLPGTTPSEALLAWLRRAARQGGPRRQGLLALSALAVLDTLPVKSATRPNG